MKIVTSHPDGTWAPLPGYAVKQHPDLELGDVLTPKFKGFGICFNELGWQALSHLDDERRDQVLALLFDTKTGCGLAYNRIPIGANDFALDWYSHNEIADDFAMAHFSVDRDERAILPYLRAAQAVLGRPMTLFASPWCPPTWLKSPPVYNFGGLAWTHTHRQAYALYLVRFVQAYAARGITIDSLHVQNEPDSNQKFPSCLWTGEQLRDFIRDDLGPALNTAGLATQIWLGTIERASYNDWIAPTLEDAQARSLITGVGFQWAGKGAIQRTRLAAPDLALIQTESECGDGTNSWDQAHAIFDLVQHYLSNGAEAYCFWNAVLNTGGLSTWGWRQNALFSVDPENRTVQANPEFHLLRHLSGFLQPGAAVISATGRAAASALIFRNPDGSHVVVLQNKGALPLARTVRLGNDTIRVDLPPRSFVTIAA